MPPPPHSSPRERRISRLETSWFIHASPVHLHMQAAHPSNWKNNWNVTEATDTTAAAKSGRSHKTTGSANLPKRSRPTREGPRWRGAHKGAGACLRFYGTRSGERHEVQPRHLSIWPTAKKKPDEMGLFAQNWFHPPNGAVYANLI